MGEKFCFRNFSNTQEVFSTRLIPLSSGCDQFTIAPKELVLDAHEEGEFAVTFTGRRVGATTAILQFDVASHNSPHKEKRNPPCEVIVEASVIPVTPIKVSTNKSTDKVAVHSSKQSRD